MSEEELNIQNDKEHITSKHFGGPLIPAGLEFLYSTCRNLYPNQPNPLQVTAVVKYWLGGPDPLDYISMYYNAGDQQQQIPPHWHYVSFGLSDLHGDGRVHEVSDANAPSGFGFELTMRVKCEKGEKSPPTWPATLMQSLAAYVFHSDSIFCAGDHISWHSALDNSESRIQHMLICEDPQLSIQNAPFGRVQFLQVIGLTAEELQVAQRWNGCGVLNIMKRFPECGGCWLVTDLRRNESIFDLDPNISEEIEEGIEKKGSNLSGVSAKVSWTVIDEESSERLERGRTTTDQQSFASGNLYMDIPGMELGGKKSSLNADFSEQRHHPGHDEYKEKFPYPSTMEKNEVFEVQPLPSLHLMINLESGSLLPLALRGRLKHGRHFTFKSPLGLNALTLLTPSVEGGFVSPSTPYAIKGPWLQVLVDEELLEKMSGDLSPLTNQRDIIAPISFEWPSQKLRITIVPDEI